MAKNRFYTLMLIPEKTAEVRKIIIPSWIARAIVWGTLFLFALGAMMVFNYWFVISQVSENKLLKAENRRLKTQVQSYKGKMSTIETSLDRIKTFATRLKVITNIEDKSNLLQSLNKTLPNASTNIGAQPKQELKNSDQEDDIAIPDRLDRDLANIDQKLTLLGQDANYVEQVLQDQYELLGDKRAFLSALPTRKPAIGYFTSGFGIRPSPFGGKIKMHEGLDIANQPGTIIKATADGVIMFADSKSGYGQTVIIDHGYGLETWYGHNRKVLVSRGQKVHRGEAVAQLGSSGRSTGPHCHYEVRVHGIPVDPLSYILEN